MVLAASNPFFLPGRTPPGGRPGYLESAGALVRRTNGGLGACSTPCSPNGFHRDRVSTNTWRSSPAIGLRCLCGRLALGSRSKASPRRSDRLGRTPFPGGRAGRVCRSPPGIDALVHRTLLFTFQYSSATLDGSISLQTRAAEAHIKSRPARIGRALYCTSWIRTIISLNRGPYFSHTGETAHRNGLLLATSIIWVPAAFALAMACFS